MPTCGRRPGGASSSTMAFTWTASWLDGCSRHQRGVMTSDDKLMANDPDELVRNGRWAADQLRCMSPGGESNSYRLITSPVEAVLRPGRLGREPV
jgi:hypothetical protein